MLLEKVDSMALAAMQGSEEIDFLSARAAFREALNEPLPRRRIMSREDVEHRAALGLPT